MRVSVAILAFVLGGSAALAQGDPRANPTPVTAAAPTTDGKAKAHPKPKATPKKEAAKETAKPKPSAEKSSDAEKTEKKEEAAPAKGKAKAAKSATAKSGTTGSATASAPAKPSGLQDTYLAIPVADRVAIQNDLTWGGDFTGPIDGEFSERLVQAVKAYQTRHKNAVTGVMSPEERKALSTAVEPRKREVGWRLTEDPVTGARVGLPGKLATKVTPGPNGTRWTSEQGQLQVETFKIDTGAALDAVFEQQKKMPRRRVESSALQTDSFVITGMQGLKKMVVRGFTRNGEVRGITILYDQAMEGTMDPLVAPMSSAYVPFTAGFAVAGVAEKTRRKVEYGTGVFVSAVGHVLTDRNLIEACNIIALPGLGNAERVATDAAGDLALLRVYGARNLTPIGMLGGSSGGTNVTLVGIADPQAQGGGGTISTVDAKVGVAADSSPLEIVPAPGFAGAPALDSRGGFAGIAVMKAPVMAGPGGVPQAAVIPAERIRNFLEANYVAPASGAAGVEPAKSSVTRVICVRK